MLFVCAACSADRDAPPRNLLFIAVDTLRADHLGAYGYGRDTSPRIDAFLESAVTFDDAHSSSSWTLPAFASMMTGLHSSSHGCWKINSVLGQANTTLAEVLAEAGFATAGVVSHVFLRAERGLAQGFESWNEELVFAMNESHEAISSPPLTERALTLLDELADADRPWFLFVHYFDPHSVYHAHPRFPFGADAIGRYDSEIAFTDEHVGRLLDRLGELDLEDETIVVFVADHGEEFGDHGRIGHGETLFVEVARVPMAIRVPGYTPRRVSDTVSVVDLMPTLLEVLDVRDAAGSGVSGRNLVPLLSGADGRGPGRLLESRLDKRLDADLEGWVTPRWKLIVEREKNVQRAPDGRLPAPTAERGSVRRVLLFDRAADPKERTDLTENRPEIVDRLRKRIEAAVAEARASAVDLETVDVGADERARLRDLGYLDDE